MTPVKYWLWLTVRLNCGPAWQVYRHFGSVEAAYYGDREAYDLIPGLNQAQRSRLENKRMEEADHILGECDRLGIRLVTYQDAAYPERLRNIDLPPLVLYLQGKEIRFDEEPAIAMAGTRRCTVYGRRMAERISYELTRLGALVVTGVVQGCDYAAATAALAAGGPVCCVLAGGLDVPYHNGCTRLYEDVRRNGLLISEYPPGTRPIGSNFVARNRILTGLSLGVVCVEAGAGSGTLLVANLAIDQNRDVYAVPGNVDSPASSGTNGLLKQGLAVAVERGADVLEHYRHLFALPRPEHPVTPEEVEERMKPVRKGSQIPPDAPPKTEKAVDKGDGKVYIDLRDHLDKFTDDQRDILLALRKHPLQADDVIDETQLPARRVISALTVLAIQGHVKELPGKRYEALTILRAD